MAERTKGPKLLLSRFGTSSHPRKNTVTANGQMSALGQKPTYVVQKSMSALHPIATAKADIGVLSCPLYPRKRTHAAQQRMSAKGHKRTSVTASRSFSSFSALAAASTSAPEFRCPADKHASPG